MTLTSLMKLLHKLAKDCGKKIFTLREIAILVNEGEASIGMSLIRAKKGGIVGRAGKQWINMIEPPNLEELAIQMKSPSYISLESALYRHGILSQSPRGYLSMVTTLRSSRISTPLGEVRYMHITPRLFFGFDKNRIATPEKAMLDLIYMRIRQGSLGSSEVFYLKSLNKRRLSMLAKKFPTYVQRGLEAL